MNPTLDKVCGSLESLSEAVLALTSENRTLNEIWGWSMPSLSRHDLASIPLEISKRIREANIESLDSELILILDGAPEKLERLKVSSIQHIFNGNGQQACTAYIGTLDWLDKIVSPVLGWQSFEANKAVPPALLRKIQSFEREITSLTLDKDDIERRIKLIKEATETAQSLPETLKSLQDTKSDINQLSAEATSLYGKIANRNEQAIQSVGLINDFQDEAAKLVQQCEEAYRVTTSKGLAGAFDEREKSLGRSMRLWVVGLIISLTAGAYLGYLRLDILSSVLAKEDLKWGVIWMNTVLSLLSVGGPIWFAWLSTKQIGQRFRLAEDYAFKASISKAYEGYRREAARLDPILEARLFSSALNRLDEPPLRLIEDAAHGSPWHELFASKSFQKALSAAPELKDKFIEVTKSLVSSKASLKEDVGSKTANPG